MSNLKNKFVVIAVIAFIIINMPLISNATGSMSSQISKTTVNEGDTFTITVSANSAAGTYSVTTNNSNATITSSGSGFLDSSSEKWTLKASKAGTVTITVKATDLIDADDDSVEINYSKTFTVTIKEKTSSSSGSSSSGSSSSNSGNSNSSSSTNTTAPKFTTVSETVYAKISGVNVRSSYSTSSSAIGSLSKGESIKRIGVATTTVNGIKWSKVTYKGQTAYVSSAYLTTTKPVVEETKTEEPTVNTTTNNEATNNEITNNETVNNEIENNEVVNNTENPIDNLDSNETITEETLKLSKLEIAGVNFTEGFNPEIYSYTLQLNFFVKDLNITAEANQVGAQVEIIGNENFTEGENNITILVTSADMQETITYQINVVIPSEVATAPQNDIQFYLMCAVIILAAILVIIIIIAIAHKSKTSDLDDSNEYSETKGSNFSEAGLEVNDKVKTKREKVKGGKHSN